MRAEIDISECRPGGCVFYRAKQFDVWAPYCVLAKAIGKTLPLSLRAKAAPEGCPVRGGLTIVEKPNEEK